jgi:hypothetical protein
LLHEALLPCSFHGEFVVPSFLGEQDHPWLRALLDEYDRYVGRRQRELDDRLREPLPCASPDAKRRVAIRVLTRHRGSRQVAAVAPRRARAAVFLDAARSAAEPAVVLARTAASLGVTADALAESLFADLPGERLVTPAAEPLSPGELALRTNLAIAQGLLFRSTAVRIELEGNARAVVRHARLRGLLCAVVPSGGDRGAALELSGPYALFRRTLVYGRALSEILPRLVWCDRFKLRADCVVGGGEAILDLASGDPIFPGEPPRRYDSKLEERFARDFRRLAPDWDVVREPEPVRAGDTLVFPDFALRHRADGRRWLVEIVGFWTREYLERKLARLRAARLSNLVLCVDESRNCGEEAAAPPSARVVRFQRRVDAAAVLRAIE